MIPHIRLMINDYKSKNNLLYSAITAQERRIMRARYFFATLFLIHLQSITGMCIKHTL